MKELIEWFNECSTIKEICIKLYGDYTADKHRKTVKQLKNLGLDVSLLKERFRLSKILPRIEKTCPVCGNTFTTKSNNGKITCGYSCSNTHFNGVSRNINISQYRTIAFRNHKKECIICGEDRIVSVHHYDENHENNSSDNLIPLCPTHHQYYHSRYKYLIDDKIQEYVRTIKLNKD